MVEQNIYTKAQEIATQMAIDVDHKLKAFGTYGVKERTPEDTRAESMAAMVDKYGKGAMQEVIRKHGG